MKIYNEIILNWNDETQQFDTIYEDSYDYNGPLDRLSPSCSCASDENCPEGYYCHEGYDGCEVSGNRVGICVEMEHVYACLDPSATNYCDTNNADRCNQCGCTGENCVECVNFSEMCSYQQQGSRETCGPNERLYTDDCGALHCLKTDYQESDNVIMDGNHYWNVGEWDGGPPRHHGFQAVCGGTMECYHNGQWSSANCASGFGGNSIPDDILDGNL